jgi:hypothetical protein
VRRECPTHAERHQRFENLREMNERMRPFLLKQEDNLRRQRDECRARLRINEVLGRRDYAFCLYPEGPLRELYRGLLAEGSQ